MNDFFSRSIALYGQEQIERLKNAKIAIFGIGGVGSYVLEALIRSGAEHITVIDNDNVEPSNLNRQIIATLDTVGMLKTEAAARRARQINENAEIKQINMFYSPDTAEAIELGEFDYIVDAIDSVKSKTELILRAQSAHVPIISSMGTGNKTDPTRIKVSDIYKTSGCPLARVMRYELKKRGVKRLNVVWSDEEPRRVQTEANKADGKAAPASAVFVPAAAGLAIAARVVKDITEK